MNAIELNPSNLIAVESAPAVINVNFDEVKAKLQTELDRYNVVVTIDTLPDAKKLATELNKSATDFDRRRKEAVATVSGPIKLFEGQMKELVMMCKNGRQGLINQIDRFEDETRKKVAVLLEALRADEWTASSVEPEFQKAEYQDLIKLTSLTKSGKLTTSAKAKVVAAVAADKQLQDRINMRLVMLENQSYKSGLTSPLSRAHVEPFLLGSDEDYQAGLSRVMKAELVRQVHIEEAAQKRIKAAADEAERAATAKAEQAAATAPAADPVPDGPASAVIAEAEAPAPQAQRFVEPTRAFSHSTAAPTKFAFGPLDNPRGATIEICSQADAETKACAISSECATGLWTPVGLIAIAYQGQLFRKAQ